MQKIKIKKIKKQKNKKLLLLRADVVATKAEKFLQKISKQK